MTNLINFTNDKFGSIRTIEIEGKPYFAGKDIAACLGYKNTREAILKYCKGVVKHDTLTKGGVQKISFISEGDLYRLITHSKLPSAEEFESWVFDEVLPSIRKNGYYIDNKKQENNEKNFDEAKSQIDLLTVTSKLLNLSDSSKLLLATKIYEDCNIPTTYLPTYTDSKGILKSATELLKESNIPISAIKFNKIMIDKGYLIEVERTSGKDKSKIKKFKNLVKTEFGENQISPKNPKETQPMYYENKFLELLKELGIK